ncbi:4Fe-4S_ferredoxin [Hexamita inflata]|uniref:4Fe-4S ferredoxin n=1 Tax=Hexamita inflata TaxID=28002 RepID=A0AA86UXJ1_9EUKA|nr:4Fe-4S ferredoxin [Hexamita inflata]CAI9957947.1 4Fe-4S ferredoxin [Hexamita inflata]CAI9959631.1 4Fe-4S ferredoxin [Hexamita inflata]CAI9968682.1 4Fe-4S ferredoxin [Hexamita inflata]CAI9969090.1 4Fe-4S ferredoxin [Hexamita inflata]
MKVIQINTELCIGCGACVDECPENALKVIDGKCKLVASCAKNGNCVSVCPVGALKQIP